MFLPQSYSITRIAAVIIFSYTVTACGGGGSSDSNAAENIVDGADESTGVTIKVLFIGNSYTSANNLPGMVNNMAESAGHKLVYSLSLPGAARFLHHNDNSDTLEKIDAEPWDFVILQNQSQVPGWKPEDVRTRSLLHAEALVRKISDNDPNTAIVYFATWGRKNGDAQNCGHYPLVCGFDGHTQALSDGYTIYAQSTGGDIAQVGEAWKNIVDDSAAPFESDDLWSTDGSHPSLLGSYLAAAVIYNLIFSEYSGEVTYTAGLSPLVSSYLQEQAAHLE